MRDLSRALGITGRPVPLPWRQVGHWVKARGQNVMLVLAAAGVGKSAWALEWALHVGAPLVGSPVLYISLDTSLFDHGVRIAARETALTVDEVQDGHDVDPVAWAKMWRPAIDDLGYKVRFYDHTPAVRDIDELITAEGELWGEPPLLTFVDNLGDILEHEESAGEYRRMLLELKRIAKHHDTLIVPLHHLRKRPATKRDRDNEDEDEGTQPVHISDALFPIDQHAQYVLGLWRPQPHQMTVGVLKNRMGPASRVGALHTTLSADLARMRITDPAKAYEHWRETS